MNARCHSPCSKDYKNYGARGITVCDEWREDFWCFAWMMGPKPSPEYSIERVDNDHIYCPENCKWATKKEQSLNRRNCTKK